MATADLAPVAIVKSAKIRKVLIRRGKFSMIVELDLKMGIVTANSKAAKLDSESLRKLRDQGFSPGNRSS